MARWGMGGERDMQVGWPMYSDEGRGKADKQAVYRRARKGEKNNTRGQGYTG